jgi:hypothetical protein
VQEQFVVAGKARVTRVPVPQLRDRERATPPEPRSALALPDGASLFDFGCVAPRSRIAADMFPRHALPKPKIDGHAAPPIYVLRSGRRGELV